MYAVKKTERDTAWERGYTWPWQVQDFKYSIHFLSPCIPGHETNSSLAVPQTVFHGRMLEVIVTLIRAGTETRESQSCVCAWQISTVVNRLSVFLPLCMWECSVSSVCIAGAI